MAPGQELINPSASKSSAKEAASNFGVDTTAVVRPQISEASSDPSPTRSGHAAFQKTQNDSLKPSSSGDLPTLVQAHPSHNQVPELRYSHSSIEKTPHYSRSSSPLPSLTSTATSPATSPSIYAPENFTSFSHRPQRSVFTRLKQSIGASSTIGLVPPSCPVAPSDFSHPSEQPEKRFVDSIGIVCPGVCDRPQCTHPAAHFVSTFRICQPIEYTTVLAEHGLTYSDYNRLLAALRQFLVKHEVALEKSLTFTISEQAAIIGSQENLSMKRNTRGITFYDTAEQFGKTRRIANALNQLLENITTNLQARGLAVVICVGSFSLFSPNRISEAHIQILHTPFHAECRNDSMAPDARSAQRLSFINPVTFANSEPSTISRSQPDLEDQRTMEKTHTSNFKHHHRMSQHRDRSRPWSLWPNAIPSTKRRAMDENATRYGTDPYFRAWMRANINSRTKSSSYTQYTIEQENNPFINRRVEYSETPSSSTLFWTAMMKGTKAWSDQSPSVINRAKYEQNRRLECRRSIEQGSRLRILRFGFRYPIYPPHTAEMGELGLSQRAYEMIMAKIDNLHSATQVSNKWPLSYSLLFWNKFRHRSTENALVEIGEYIRELNASQRRVVWTIERIPCVYDRGLARDRTEWEISAWNGEDPLELLIQLERWGLIERRLSIDEDE